MSNVLKKVIILVTTIAVISSIVGCGETKKDMANTTTVESKAEGTTAEATGAQNLEKLEYSFYVAHQTASTNFVSEEDDAFSKFVEKKFNIKVGQIYENQGLGYKERINLLIASDDLPDVVSIYGDATTIPATGRYAELGDLIKENCPNYMELMPEKYWKSMSYNGKVYSMGSSIARSMEELGNDPYYKPPVTWAALFTSEKVLEKCGYTFTPLTEINKKIQAGAAPSYDLFKITPEIKTEEDFYNFLKKIKTETPKVNGKDVIPFSIPVFLQPHFAYIFGTPGHWKFDPTTKTVHSFFDDPNAKNYWKFMNKLYKEGLLDKNFSVQKPEQLNENILNGRIKSYMYSLTWPSNSDVQKALRAADPSDNVRAIPMPMAAGAVDVGQFYYGRAPVMYYINKDFKDIPRLLKYFDWWLSKEGLETASWGPEELGLWEVKDGKRMWKSEELFTALKNGDSTYLDANFNKYGYSLNPSLMSKIIYSVPSVEFNNHSFWHSYPLAVGEDDTQLQLHYISNVREKAMEREGYLAAGADEASQKIDGFLWGEFINQIAPGLFAAQTDADFEKAWDELNKHLNEKLNYATAKKNMELFFKVKGFK